MTEEARGFTVTTALALSDVEKAYIRRVMNDRFIGLKCTVIDRAGQAEMTPPPPRDERKRGGRR